MILRSLLSATLGLTLAACASKAPVSDNPTVSISPPPPAAPPAPTDGIVSTADPRATQAGKLILDRGGSATDAAIAVMLTLTVVEPQSSGIGGGGFFVRGTPDGTVTTLDGRETAPMAAAESWFLDEEGEPLGYREAVLSGLSVGVPGNISLAAEAHARHGKLPWASLFSTAIFYAREGFHITPRFHFFLQRAKGRADLTPEGRALFFGEDGEPLPANTKITNPALANTLEQIAQNGPEWFYESAIAGDMMRTVAAATPHDVAMNRLDFDHYKTKERPPVCGTYRGYRVCGMGPPSSGATTVLGILGAIELFDIAAMGPESTEFWHVFAEAQRLAYADRERYLADPDFVPVPIEWLTDKDYLASRGAMISAEARLDEAVPGTPPETALAPPDGDEPVEHGTSHFSVLDSEGNGVSYTSTIEGPFGSGLMAGGFYLNNELTDFSFSPEKDGRPVANRVEGGKRPRSSMAPTIIYAPNGSLFMVVGAAGGGTIPVQTTRAIIAAIDFGMDAEGSLALPMLYSPGNRITLEEESSVIAFQPSLEALGHTVSARRLPLKANAILCRSGPGSCEGAADPRSEGTASSQ